MSRRIAAVILDLDGVLTDTARYHFQAWKRLAEDENIVFTREDNEHLRGVSRRRSLELLLGEHIDRYSEAVLLFGLLVYFARRHDTTEVILIFATVVGAMIISYVRARAEGLGLDAEVGLMRRTVRICALALGLLINQILVFLWILAILTNFTAWQRLSYVWRKTSKHG